MNLPNFDLTLEDYKSIIEEISLNKLESRYVPKNLQWSLDEETKMKQFMADYYNLYLQGNDTVTQLSNNDLFKYTIINFDQKAK